MAHSAPIHSGYVMNQLPDNELFSAYLDGELTAEEEAQVEHLVASNPAARHLLDELRSLSQTLQTLPPQKLGEDLSPYVLRTAERRMLAESSTPNRRSGANWGGVPWTLIWNRLRQPRIFVWAGMSVAIAVALSLYDAQQRPVEPAPPAEVAAAPTPDSAPAKPVTVAPASAEVVTRIDAAPVVSAAPPTPASVPAPSASATAASSAASLAGSPAPETGPASAGEPAKTEPTTPASASPPAEKPWVVRGAIRAEAAEQGLLEKLLAEQKIPKQDNASGQLPPKSSAGEQMLQVRIVVTGSELKALWAAMQEQSAVFSALALEVPSVGVPTTTATAAPVARQATVGSVVVEKGTSHGRKSAAKSRVLFDRDAPPIPSPVEDELELPAGDANVAHPILVELRVIPTAER